MDLIDRRLCLLAELRQIEWEIERARELEAVNELSPPNTEFAPSVPSGLDDLFDNEPEVYGRLLGAVRPDRESCSDVDN